MGVCFICDVKLYGERTRVCSSIAPHSNIPYPEKIAEIMGEEFLIVVTPADHLCKKCTSLLTHMDKLENDLKVVKNAILSFIQKKYGIIPADQPIKSFDIVNGTIKMDDLETSQRKVPSGLTIRNTSVNSPLKMTKPLQPETSSKLKIYKCGFCTFQSKELGHVRFHMRSHMNKKGDGEKTAQTGTKLLTPASSLQQQKKRLYRCQVCSISFDSRQICLDHIQKDHNQQTVLNSNDAKEDISSEISKGIVEETQQAGVSAMDICDDQQKDAVDMDMLLNDDLPAERSQQESQNPDGHVSTQVDAMQIDLGTNIEKGVDEDMAIGGGDNKTGDLDIESMLAAIHHDTPHPDVGNTHNVV